MTEGENSRKVGRPSALIKLVGNKSIEARATAVAHHYKAAACHHAASGYHAVMAGVELLAAREQIPHGQWLPWLADNAPFSHDTARLLMEVANRTLTRAANVASARGLIEGRDVAQLDDGERTQLIATVREWSKNLSYRHLLLEMGVITAAKPRGGDHGGGKVRAKMTPAQRRERQAELARSDWREIETALSQWLATKAWQHLEALDRVKVRHALEAALALVPAPVFGEERGSRRAASVAAEALDELGGGHGHAPATTPGRVIDVDPGEPHARRNG